VKLLIYSHYFAPSVGGVETVVFALACGLTEQRGLDGSPNFEVTVVTETPAGHFQDGALPFRIERQPRFSQLRALILEADVIHVAGPALRPILYGLLLRKPLVVEHHGFQTICPTGQLFQEPESLPCPGHFMAGRHINCLRCSLDRDRLLSLRLWLLTFLRRFLCRHIAVNIMPTHWLSSQLALPRSETIHHGLQGTPPLARVFIAKHTPVLVFVGRLVTTKGVNTIIEACQILRRENRDFELRLIGEGPERSSLETLVRERGLSSLVHFLGSVAQSEMPKILGRADLVIIPSLGGEVFGMVVAENMMRGIPIIASDLGAFLEVLGDSGLTFRTGDATDLARQIARLMDDSSLQNRLQAASHTRVFELFTLDRMINGHAEIYRRIMSKSVREK
jgi:glycosyltransferase involved in cell wall biosynthesis